MAKKEAPKTAFVWVLNGQVSALAFPGEPVSHNPGTLVGEFPIDQVQGVGEVWPPKDTKAKPAKPKAADTAA